MFLSKLSNFILNKTLKLQPLPDHLVQLLALALPRGHNFSCSLPAGLILLHLLYLRIGRRDHEPAHWWLLFVSHYFSTHVAPLQLISPDCVTTTLAHPLVTVPIHGTLGHLALELVPAGMTSLSMWTILQILNHLNFSPNPSIQVHSHTLILIITWELFLCLKPQMEIPSSLIRLSFLTLLLPIYLPSLLSPCWCHYKCYIWASLVYF